jgi:hypothetical protein
VDDLAEALSTPYRREGRIADWARADGADEATVAALTAGVRLLKAYEGEFSPSLIATLAESLFGAPKPVATRPPTLTKHAMDQYHVTGPIQRLTATERVEKAEKEAMARARARRASGAPSVGAWSEIERRATSIVSKSYTPLSKAEAVVKALELNPALYDRYCDEQAAAIAGEAEAEQAARRRDLRAWQAEQL